MSMVDDGVIDVVTHRKVEEGDLEVLLHSIGVSLEPAGVSGKYFYFDFGGYEYVVKKDHGRWCYVGCSEVNDG